MLFRFRKADLADNFIRKVNAIGARAGDEQRPAGSGEDPGTIADRRNSAENQERSIENRYVAVGQRAASRGCDG